MSKILLVVLSLATFGCTCSQPPQVEDNISWEILINGTER